jgi:hypothetical protein
MIAFLIVCFAAGIVIAVPVWIASQRFGARRGLQAVRRFNPDDAVPCALEPVALKGRLMPDLGDVEDHGVSGEKGDVQ